MNRRLSLFFMLLVFISMPFSVSAAVREDAVLQKYFTLYQSQDKDPYTLYYPIEVTRPGEITISVNVSALYPKPKNQNYEPLRIILVDSRAFKKMEPSQWKKWAMNVNEYNPLEYIAGDEIRAFVKGVKKLFGKKDKKPSYYHGQMACGKDIEGRSETIRHAVDDPEFNKTQGRYVIIFRNMAKMKANGTLYISYPGEKSELDPEAEKLFDIYPDLTVEDVSLNNEKLLTVKVANRSGGTGVHIGRWKQTGPDAITLHADVEGRGYGVTLPAADPAGRLRRPRSSLTYVFDKVKITKSTRVTVTVDATGKVMETDENNNSKTVQLGPPTATLIPQTITGRPDLTVSGIRLDAGKRIVVEIANIGIAGLDPSLWNSGSQPHLNLKMNGNGWSNVSLAMVDRDKNLAKPGGRALYSTGYVLRQNATVRATIDADNVIAEGNESNNTTEAALRP